MFIEFKNSLYGYLLIDSEFQIEIKSHISFNHFAVVAVELIKIYKEKNLNIIHNLFLYVLFVCNHPGRNIKIFNFIEFLNNYISSIDPKLNFSNLYYNDLIKYTNKMIILL